ncbi:tRNA1(Val) (adenine(37)-N6)-methyltransferase [Ekhidna sp. To15]|uniref:tRNA1(Val) (adenine(37)-N6)-methyltransferase n=1 Tax=Ekhidna sp. To15 TaxID=3395267 RepID=UPI003F51FE32
MPNSYFQFKRFRVEQALSGMKVTTDACLFGAWVADEIKELGKRPKQILDIGTGTGLLSLMVAQMNDDTHIDAVEVNKEAFEEANRNFVKSPWSNRLTCKHTSIQDFDDDRYDVIICNPPFFQSSFKGKNSSKNQALHSSLLPMNDLIKSLHKLMSNEGYFYLLYPEREMDQFISLAEKSKLYPAEIVTVRNKERSSVFRNMARFEFHKKDLEESELMIRRDDRKYTTDFWKLLKDYYLDYNDPAMV